jgi:hypothetical protein
MLAVARSIEALVTAGSSPVIAIKVVLQSSFSLAEWSAPTPTVT